MRVRRAAAAKRNAKRFNTRIAIARTQKGHATMHSTTRNEEAPALNSDEDMLNLPEASKYVRQKWRRKVHHSTLWRWCCVGVNGITLEYVKVGRRIVTSEQALARFFHRLARAQRVAPTSTRCKHREASAHPSSSHPSSDYQAARSRLDHEGF